MKSSLTKILCTLLIKHLEKFNPFYKYIMLINAINYNHIDRNHKDKFYFCTLHVKSKIHFSRLLIKRNFKRV